MTGVLHIAAGIDVPLSEIEVSFSRSGGAGGQNVNKRDTRVEAVFDLAATGAIGPRRKLRALERLSSRLDSDGRLRVVASDERSQIRNRELALERLAAILAEAVAPPPPVRRATRPSRAAVQRRLSAKAVRSKQKEQRRRPGAEDT